MKIKFTFLQMDKYINYEGPSQNLLPIYDHFAVQIAHQKYPIFL